MSRISTGLQVLVLVAGAAATGAQAQGLDSRRGSTGDEHEHLQS